MFKHKQLLAALAVMPAATAGAQVIHGTIQANNQLDGIVQNDIDNGTPVGGSIPTQSDLTFEVINQVNGTVEMLGDSSRGDAFFRLRAEGSIVPIVHGKGANGAYLTTVANNERADASFPYGTSAARLSGGDSSRFFHISSGISATAGGEYNVDTSFAYFSWADGFYGGFYDNNSSTADAGDFAGATGINFGTQFIDNEDGSYTVDLTGLGIDSRTDGILLASSGRNETTANYALSQVESDGTFTILSHGNAVNGGNLEADKVAFVYMPTVTPPSDVVAAGRIDTEGDASLSTGNFNMTQLQAGEWFLDVPGLDPTASTLILTGNGQDHDEASSVTIDNLISFEIGQNNGKDGWVIQSRDITGSDFVPFQLQGGAQDEIMFNFAVFGELAALLAGDLNGSGFVDGDDLNIILGAWGANVTPGDLLSGDPSGNGFVDGDDLNEILSNWGQGTPPTVESLQLAAITAVPEPTSLALLAMGGLLMSRRRR